MGGKLVSDSIRKWGITLFMAEQDTGLPRKKRGPKPTGKGHQIQVRMLPGLLGPLDKWRSEQPDPKPTRPEAIRHMVKIFLGLK
jgi:hypothetical protein